MKRYSPKNIEPKWQQEWADQQLYQAVDFDQTRPKFVMLTEFPYPSGDGLHLGHVREYTLGDIMARHKRMTGHNVLFPMGYDEFGLPTENYAIKHKVAPQTATEQNVSNFQKQFESLGYSIDWSRKVRTSDPSYYKWTQWLFLQFFKSGLAYQDEIDINWCPKCKTGLANEEVVNGRHERCDTPVEKKTLNQWLLKITDYANRLVDGLDTVDYPSRIADQQINWIGRSKGAEIQFAVEGHTQSLTVFTTRPDTLFGATFMVLAPEHPLVEKITTESQESAVKEYVVEAGRKSDIERQDTNRDKTGVFTGAYAMNPINQARMPIWIADYVLAGYGTGAIMAVPAHDERDYEFAKKFDIPIIEVVEPIFGEVQGDETNKPSIIGIVYNKKDDAYLVLDWGPRIEDRWGGKLFVGGGIEKGEDIIETAKREIAEETGYNNLKYIRQTAVQAHSYFYSNVKEKNMYAPCTGVLFELEDARQISKQLEDGERDKFRLIWVPGSKIDSVVDVAIHHYMFKRLVRDEPYTGEGVMVNSGKYDGMASSEAREKIVQDLIEAGAAKEKMNYRLRDWIFSRQHYWGEPIPIIHCEKCGAVAVPDYQLPVELPAIENYEPTDTGESPLAAISDWVNIECPKCHSPAKRETDTMPNWAGSSWYYLRYYDAHNDNEFADREKLDYWGMVDMYLGGMEHTTLHLLYSRFWHQFFYDQGLVPTPEPYAARRGQGIVLATDGSKMSKSKGNVINPNAIIEQGYGADALRIAIAFLAPFDQTTPWNPEGVAGTHRFLNRIWTLTQEYRAVDNQDGQSNPELLRVTHKAIKKISEDLHNMAFNTAVSALMEFVNELYKIKAEDKHRSPEWPEVIKTLLQILAPFAPHMAEELWHELNQDGSIHISAWPVHNERYLVSDTVTVVVQVNGKVRANVEAPADSEEASAVKAAQADQKVQKYLEGQTIKKTIYVKDRLINFVV